MPDRDIESLPFAEGSCFGGPDGARFRVEAKAGEGGQAVVFKAMDTRLSRRVAVKVCVAPDGAARRLFMRRFEREMVLTSRVDHPHVLQIHDCGELPGGYPFVLLEWMEHGALTGLIDRLQIEGRLMPMSYVSYYARAIGAAVRAMHAADVVHRDIKPDNVLVGRDGVVKVTDFGIARDMTPGAVQITDTGDTVGTPGFMAPEQLQGKAGPLSDLFSLGVTLYVMMTGMVPLQESASNGVPTGLILEEAWRSIPESVAPVLRRLCADWPEERYQSMRAALAAIEAADWSEAPRPLPQSWELPPLPSSVFVSGATSAHDVEPITEVIVGRESWRQVAVTTTLGASISDPDTVDLAAADLAAEVAAKAPTKVAPTATAPAGEPMEVDQPTLPQTDGPPPRGGLRAALPWITGLGGLLLGGLVVLMLSRGSTEPTPVETPAPTATAAATPEPILEPLGAVTPSSPAPIAAPQAPVAMTPAPIASTLAPVAVAPTPAPEPSGDRCEGIDIAATRSLSRLDAAQVACLQDTAMGRRGASDPEIQESAVTLYNRRADGWPAAVEAALLRPALGRAPALAFAGIKPAYDGARYGVVQRRAHTVWANLDKGYDLSSADVAFVAEYACRASAQIALAGGDSDEGVTWCERWYELAEQIGKPTAPIQDILDQLE